jgi:phage baseplate assembly protein V
MSVARGIIRLVSDSLKVQELQVSLLADETRDGVERFAEYGFTSHPLPGAECIVVCVGGSRDHGIAIATEDRRYRKRDLQQGEVAVYDDQEQTIHLKRGKIIHIYGCNQVLIEAVENMQVNSPNINLGGDRGGLRALIDERIIASYNDHTHGQDGKPVQKISTATVATEVVKGK